MRCCDRCACLAIVSVLLALAPVAEAQTPGSDFMGCVGIRDSVRRLTCYDRAAATAQNLPEAQKPDFTPGKPLHVRPKPREAAVTVDLQSVSTTSDGRPVFRLANGQVWQGEDDDPVYPEASRNTVTISQSSLGLGYRLRMNRETRDMNVTRMQ